MSRSRPVLTGLAGFAAAALLPVALWHRAIELVASDFRLDPDYPLTGRTGHAPIGLGLVLMVLVVVSIGRRPDARLYPRSRNAYLGGACRCTCSAPCSRARSPPWPPCPRRNVHWAAVARFSEPPDPLFQALNSSIAFDMRLAPFDVEQSLAHARMLAGARIIAEDELAVLERGLRAVLAEIEEDLFEIEPGDEDVHMAVERRLTEIVGPVGGKLHTARSRNDQVATDVAMLVRAHARSARELLSDLMETLLDAAERHLDWSLPGYTHLQRAQPVYLSHHLLAHLWRFHRDAGRFAAAAAATAELPLGSGALAGVNFQTDRDFLAAELGFERVAPNSLDAVSNRDFVLDYLAAAATCATHLSQLGAEIVIWSSEEFGFCEVSDAFASGSSLMPQKKNPDAAELLRAKAPRVVSRLVGLHGVLHGLPLTYNKDLQEDKEPLFDAVDTLELCLTVAAAMLRTIAFHRERMAAAAADEFLAATDVADLLVRRGVPFREAHSAVGGLVRGALERGRSLSELSAEEVRELAPELDGAGLTELLREHTPLRSKISSGGTSLERVREQLERARGAVEESRPA